MSPEEKIKGTQCCDDLSIATKNKHHQCVIDILSRSKKTINSKDLLIEKDEIKEGLALIHYLKEKDTESAIDLILKYPNASSYYNPVTMVTSLHWACYFGNRELVKLLLKKGISPDSFDEHSQTPLHLSIQSGDIECVQLILSSIKNNIHPQRQRKLINSKNYLGYSPLLFASIHGNKDIFDLLLSYGADINTHDSEGMSGLSASIINQHESISLRFIELGAKIDTSDSSSNTPLHYACERRNLSIVQKLIETNKIDVNQRRFDGSTPFHLAAFQGSEEICHLLLSKSNEVPFTNLTSSCHTPLHIAAQSGLTSVVKSLINEHKCDKNAKAINQVTALHLAIEGERNETATLLIESKAELDSETKEGFTALHMATRKGNLEIVKKLLIYGAHSDVRSKDGLTPIMLAVLNANIEMFMVLLEGGSDLGILDNNGHSVLHHSAILCNPVFIHILISIYVDGKLPKRLNPFENPTPSSEKEDNRTSTSGVFWYEPVLPLSESERKILSKHHQKEIKLDQKSFSGKTALDLLKSIQIGEDDDKQLEKNLNKCIELLESVHIPEEINNKKKKKKKKDILSPHNKYTLRVNRK